MRFFLIILLFFVTFGVFAEIEDTNGFDWITWNVDQKTGYIYGFLSAFSSMREMVLYENPEPTKEELEYISNTFYVPMTVGEIYTKIDNYYSSYDCRKFPLYDVFLVVTGKDYWN